MAETTAEKIARITAELADVRAAIAAVLRNQSYVVGDRSLTRANLRELRTMEKEKERELEALEGGSKSSFRVGYVEPPA